MDAMTEIAQRHFPEIITLEERGRDHLDFHQVHVLTLKAALQAAFDAGNAARAEGTAPDLLAALRRLVEWNDQDRGEGFLEDALHAARGAIAKAEG